MPLVNRCIHEPVVEISNLQDARALADFTFNTAKGIRVTAKSTLTERPSAMKSTLTKKPGI